MVQFNFGLSSIKNLGLCLPSEIKSLHQCNFIVHNLKVCTSIEIFGYILKFCMFFILLPQDRSPFLFIFLYTLIADR